MVANGREMPRVEHMYQVNKCLPDSPKLDSPKPDSPKLGLGFRVRVMVMVRVRLMVRV